MSRVKSHVVVHSICIPGSCAFTILAKRYKSCHFVGMEQNQTQSGQCKARQGTEHRGVGFVSEGSRSGEEVAQRVNGTGEGSRKGQTKESCLAAHSMLHRLCCR